MILSDIKYSLSDLAIVPTITTQIKSRSECNPYYFDNKYKRLPIFTAPMEGVCNDKNYQVFEREGITSIIHRNVPLEKRLELLDLQLWCAYSLKEFEDIFVNLEHKFIPGKKYYALLDVANGHMQQIFDLAKQAKSIANQKGYKLVLMGGNIANPNTYDNYCNAGIDYVRCSIGTGSQCLTSANTAIHYPNASLIEEILVKKRRLISLEYLDRTENTCITKIIADGGMGNTEEAFSRSIIALALGADYVMIGGAFSSFVDSSALFCDINNKFFDSITLHNRNNKKFKEFFTEHNCNQIDKYGFVQIKYEQIYNDNELAKFIINNYKTLRKVSFGMSSKQAQENNPNFNGKYKTSEGKSIVSDVKYTCHSWTENFIAYLKSTMSYCNARTLNDFIGKQTLIIKSSGTHFTVNK